MWIKKFNMKKKSKGYIGQNVVSITIKIGSVTRIFEVVTTITRLKSGKK